MNIKPYLLTLLLFGSISLQSGYAKNYSPSTTRNIGAISLAFDGAERISHLDLEIIRSNLTDQNYLNGHFDEDNAIASTMSEQSSLLSEYATVFPHTTQAPISSGERFLLKTYLNHPDDSLLVSFIALVNLNKSLVSSLGRRQQGEGLKYTILSNYFLRRAHDLGRTEFWIGEQIEATKREIDKVLKKEHVITSEENHEAHKYFNEAFNYHEENRYIALNKLLLDFTEHPKNVYTAFAITAINLWIGGEGDYDDPTVLHNFVLGSYFSIYTMKLAKKLETDYLDMGTPRFRMASILGGFSVSHRRWLAKLHGQQDAVNALDEEHRQWRLIHRAFHAFTVGLSLFEEPQNFKEGLAAWGDAFAHCREVPVRTCSNLPRFAHNFSSFVLGYVDFLLKDGDTKTAAQFLEIRNMTDQFPQMIPYPQWDLGRAAWEHREENLEQIAALYTNADPSDDPIHHMLKKRKWGSNTQTCQSCHQAQGSVFTEEEKNHITLPPEQVATVGIWPKVSTTWYGVFINAEDECPFLKSCTKGKSNEN